MRFGDLQQVPPHPFGGDHSLKREQLGQQPDRQAEPQCAERYAEQNRMVSLERAATATARRCALTPLPLCDLGAGEHLLNAARNLLCFCQG